MAQSDARAVGMLGAVVVALGFASCGRAVGGDRGEAGAAGEPQAYGAGVSGKGGTENRAGAASSGSSTVLGGTGGGSGAGHGGVGLAGAEQAGAGAEQGGAGAEQGGAGGAPDDMACAAGRWWSSATNSCHACPAKAKVECDEIVAGASYDVARSILTLHLPPGRLQIASAALGVTFDYANGDPEQYAEVKGFVAGDTLSFDFSAYGGPLISYLSGEPTIYDSCGGSLNVHAPGVGFGPAISVSFEDGQGLGGAGGAASLPQPQIGCGQTN